jgi:hypothetical protein
VICAAFLLVVSKANKDDMEMFGRQSLDFCEYFGPPFSCTRVDPNRSLVIGASARMEILSGV